MSFAFSAILFRVRYVLLLLCCLSLSAETLGERLEASAVPLTQFANANLNQPITSYAVSKAESDPFLLAYYVDDGSGQLRPPLRLILYRRVSHELRRADLPVVKTGDIDCLGSALSIGETHNTILLNTHITPSAGCLVVLSPQFKVRAAVWGGLLAMVGSRFVIFAEGEIHFMSVHPLHVSVLDLNTKAIEEVYPVKNDPERQSFSKLIAPRISEKWCVHANAQCDPTNFDSEIQGDVAVDERAMTFAFTAQFDANGFWDTDNAPAPDKEVRYVFKRVGGHWQYAGH